MHYVKWTKQANLTDQNYQLHGNSNDKARKTKQYLLLDLD